MQNSLLQIITEEETDLLDLEIYEKFPYLREEKQKFNEQAQNICNLYAINSIIEDEETQYSIDYCYLLSPVKTYEDQYSQYSKKNPQIKKFQDSPKNELIKKSQRFPKTSLNKIEQGFFSSLQEIVFYKFKDLLISNQNSQFYGLDDSIIELNEIKLDGDGRITYKNKQDLKAVTFLISGYLTQDFSASENFQVLANTKNKECQDNLFIFFKWSDSRLYKILDKFLNNCINNYEPKIYQDYLKELLDSCLQEHFNQIVITSIYWLIQLLGKCVKLAGPSFFQNQIKQFKTALDSIIEDFQATYEQAKIGGAILAESINNQNLMGSLNIDFMGHSLGTVVTAYALKNLSIPARYLMLFGGAATIEEIEDYQQKFQKCYNFYSDNDSVIKTFLIKVKLIGDQAFIEKKMVDSLIKLLEEEEEDFLSQEIYEQFPFLKEEKEAFNTQAKSFCLKQAENKLENEQDNPNLKSISALQINQADTTSAMLGGNYQQSIDSKEEKVVGDMTNVILQKFEELKKEKINLKESYHFNGLDNNTIEWGQIKKDKDGRIKYKNKQDLKIITFLISGYTTQESEPSYNFEKLANSNNIESQTNLFVIFKWSDSSILRIIKTFFKNFMDDYQDDSYQKYLKDMINKWIEKWKCSDIIKKIAYWVIKLLVLCIKLAKFTSYFLRKIINLLETALDSIIEDFQAAYQQSKNGGAALAEYVNSLELMGHLKIDFMGHSLGTVVTAYALKKLAKPARYIILMGGAATITEIEESYQRFQMCYNFYSTHDNVIKIFLEYAQLIGDQDFIGTKSFGLNENFFNQNTEIDHLDYSNKYQEFYDTSMKSFEDLTYKNRIQVEEKVKKSISTPEKPNYMKIGGAILGIAGGSLLLYLFIKHSKRVYN
ncbi:transmembrane protein, putative (macronuclear) [Tetrahymena thermophila SB210]|uniref:Transmembrane protein, putative n=1 Tax=Tetrahymena thermophila (strain SB210) TaxID=312017 RepID=Q231S6_TETTS|nr:transmembrane protein, putative [Tetrahymena thermophila SB210]EAR91226.2 transmembrane protein, putative [Tetrahymena thermophila SB210]|eukprot:XP_001011471.2 transmembrane protein, putative [Tetrahymena thermophila SB210]